MHHTRELDHPNTVTMTAPSHNTGQPEASQEQLLETVRKTMEALREQILEDSRKQVNASREQLDASQKELDASREQLEASQMLVEQVLQMCSFNG